MNSMKICPKCQWRSDSNEKFCPQCGSALVKDKSNKKGKKWIGKACIILLAAACVTCFMYALNMSSKADDYRDLYWSAFDERNSYKQKYEVLSDEYDELVMQKESYEKKADFLDKYIGIVNAKASENIYHKYDCSLLGMDKGEWSIRAYNISQAESLGYEPCPECH